MNETKQLWLNEALALVPEFHGREELREHLTHAMRRCHAKSRKTFWMWLRLTLAKNPDTVHFLYEMQENRVPPEVVPETSDGFEYTISEDGSTALISVGDEKVHAVWCVPVASLDWARAQFPVWLRRLPDLEPPELQRQRAIKHRLRYLGRYMTKDQKGSLQKEVADLDEQVKRAYEPLPRYCLMKSQDGRDVPVHRLFLDADDAEIEAIDGDFLNFCPVKIRVTLEPVVDDGIAGGRGVAETSVVEVSNLQIVKSSEEKQEKFERGFLQFKRNSKGELVAPVAFYLSEGMVRSDNGQAGHSNGLTVRPNADLGQVCNTAEGRFENAGKFAPVRPSEEYAPERFGRKRPQRTLDADTIRRAWRASRRARGF